MIVHVVLFTPRSDLREDEVNQLSTTLDLALREIPSVRRYLVGRRFRTGAAYDAAAPQDFHYLVTAEFDDADGLAAYVRHPRHEALGQLFYQTSALALASDFQVVDREVPAAIAAWRRE